MNNHWGTNYRQYQEGPVTFRYVLRPHQGFDPLQASELAVGLSQPLLVRQSTGSNLKPPFRLDGDAVVILSFKPADSGKGFHVSLFNPRNQTARFTVQTGLGRVWLSDTGERRLAPAPERLELDPLEVVTLLID
jgi:hypothetical protein